MLEVLTKFRNVASKIQKSSMRISMKKSSIKQLQTGKTISNLGIINQKFNQPVKTGADYPPYWKLAPTILKVIYTKSIITHKDEHA